MMGFIKVPVVSQNQVKIWKRLKYMLTFFRATSAHTSVSELLALILPFLVQYFSSAQSVDNSSHFLHSSTTTVLYNVYTING